MGTFLHKTKTDSSKSYTSSFTTSTIIISTHAVPFSLSWNKIQKRMEATLISTELPIYYGTKEIATSLQFHYSE